MKYSSGIVYNNDTVELNIYNNIYDISKYIASLKLAENEKLFFRGHSRVNYKLLPSVMRNEGWRKNEHRMYNDIMIECPEHFLHCNTHLEKLVEMQHYGLPTRLLDITRNPLVALYFACENKDENPGEIVLISATDDDIKYPNSDTVSMPASLAPFSHNNKKELAKISESGTPSKINSSVWDQFLHEVRMEKPSFSDHVKVSDLYKNYIVCALKNNRRIVQQNGAFIICGLNSKSDSLDAFRYRNKSKKKIIMVIDKKKDIISQLNDLSINRANLFPEIECVAEFIKNRYS